MWIEGKTLEQDQKVLNLVYFYFNDNLINIRLRIK